ncbi:MAG: right-handed parallel beta-helix repeat-containing protein [Planctomycetota bacterium]
MQVSALHFQTALLVGGALFCPTAAGRQIAGADVFNGALRPAYTPEWSAVPALRTLELAFDPGLSDVENGQRLKDRLETMTAGDTLLVGAGRWSVNSFFQVDLQGTPTAPIRVVGQPGAVLTRPNAGQNVINFGSTTDTSTRYLLLRGFRVEGGSYGIRIQNSESLWIDQCVIQGAANAGVGANSHDTDQLTVTRCEVYDTGGTGEGLYLGGNNGSFICSRAVVALNHIHDTGGSQGDGIELKQGSWGCLIAENVIHDTPYPGILVYGTDGNPINVIEANVVWNTGTNPFQIQGEALVRNNLIFSNVGPALQSGPHQAGTNELKVIGNTFFTRDDQAAFLRSWGGKSGMMLVNNVFYSETGQSVHVNGGLDGVTVASNVVLGPVWGVASSVVTAGFTQGRGLEDFVDVTWSGSRRDARPTGMSALNRTPFSLSSGEWRFDLTGAVRTAGSHVGALEPGTYGRYMGRSTRNAPRLRTRFPLQTGAASYTIQVEDVEPFTSVYVSAQLLDAVTGGPASPGAGSGAGSNAPALPPVQIRGTLADASGRATISLDADELPGAGERLLLRAATRSPAGRERARRLLLIAR